MEKAKVVELGLKLEMSSGLMYGQVQGADEALRLAEGLKEEAAQKAKQGAEQREAVKKVVLEIEKQVLTRDV